ncbi:probable Plasma membrane iron permease [Zygosaccharomyces bailii ISA1307]|nr:probable Plasma membrane iron permease [Zygosaccharomyces bailii ISA1307]
MGGGSNKVFNVAVFFVVFRECLEAVVVVSVLLSFLKQSIGENDWNLYKKLRRQVWIGVVLGFIVCLAIGGGMIGAYYSQGNDIFGGAEDLWEGIFCMIATIMISAMGIPMLRINKMQSKWRVKIAKAMVAEPSSKMDYFKFGFLCKKYAMFLLPFVTVLREGLEAVVFVAGAGITTENAKGTSYPLPVFIGLIAGGSVGLLLYYGTSRSSMQIFLIISTCILYLISAGLFSRGAWYFDNYRFNQATGGDASESGDGNGSYNIKQTIYHVNCCNPELDNGWDVFNALLGWQNTGYYSSMISYNIYWLFMILFLSLLMYEEKKGHLPFTKNLQMHQLNPMYHIKNKKKNELTREQEEELFARLEGIKFDKSHGGIIHENVNGEEIMKEQGEGTDVDGVLYPSHDSSSQYAGSYVAGTEAVEDDRDSKKGETVVATNSVYP